MKSVFFDLDDHETGDFADEIAYKRKVLKIVLILSALLFLYYCINSLLLEEAALAFLNSACLCLSLAGLFFSYRKYEFVKALAIYRVVTLCYAILLMALHLHIFGILGRLEFIVWTAAIPAFYFFLLGLKEGTIFSSVYILLMAYAFFSNPDSHFSGEDRELKTQTFFALVAVAGLCYCYELVRNHIKKSYFDSRRKLREAQSNLESNNKELQEIVFDLNKTKRQLEKLNTELEIRVEKRTLALSEKNRKLTDEIQERKKAEKKLRESETKYRQIVENAPVAILEFDLVRNRFSKVNPEMWRVLGYSEEELLQINPYDLFEGDYKKKLKVRLEKITSSGQQPPPFEYIVRTKDGKPVWIYGSTKLFFEHGQAVKTLTVAQNITERKILEQKFLQIQKQEALVTLAGGIAHNFNNLMMGIQGNAAMAAFMVEKDNPARKYLANLEKIIDDASELTEKFLRFTRGGKYETKVTDVEELVARAVSIFEKTRKDVVLIKYFEEGLRTVEVDRGQIEQVVLNILVNSWQAMPGGGKIYLDVRMFEVDGDAGKDHLSGYLDEGWYVKISIADEGVGMDEDIVEKIFDPFFSTRNDDKGKGLGLSSAYGIVKNHRGHIHATSEPGKGSTFEIFLPASVKKARRIISDLPLRFPADFGSVLLVDDEKSVLDTATPMLEILGCEVATASGGEEALELLKRYPARFNLVVLDMIMPDMSGFKVFEEIRKIAPKMHIIFASGYDLRADVEKLVEPGSVDFIGKPFRFKEISQKVIEMAEKFESGQSA